MSHKTTISLSFLTTPQKLFLSQHRTRYLVESGNSCSPRRAEELAHGYGLSLATAAYPGNKLVKRNPKRHPTSHNSQTDGSPAWLHCPNILFVPDSSGPKLAAPLRQATGKPRARTPLSLVGKRPHWFASAARFRTNANGCYGHCKPLSQANAVGVGRRCRTRILTHMANVCGITCSKALREFNFSGDSERPEISPEPPPIT
ncbi:hypothetical protein TcG_05969 [Trypanosoma cruzi]|nr:hypothetical protein TcG_05969 [Trypanosoma cruzi]